MVPLTKIKRFESTVNLIHDRMTNTTSLRFCIFPKKVFGRFCGILTYIQYVCFYFFIFLSHTIPISEKISVHKKTLEREKRARLFTPKSYQTKAAGLSRWRVSFMLDFGPNVGHFKQESAVPAMNKVSELSNKYLRFAAINQVSALSGKIFNICAMQR